MTEEVNQRIGDYQILNELGSGGMGRVYRVRNVISDRIEAMKVLLPDLAGRQELAARFLREIKLMASLNHPNIAALRTAFTADNQLIMVMEYVEGTTLSALLEKGPIPAADAVRYIDQALDALSYAHQQHVIHRDIKPANMMLTPQGVIKLMDFGIARAGDEHTLTMTGTTLGSLGYMSPEQVKGESTDARSDLYSVGVSLYEMVTGQRPFRAESDYAIMAAHVRETPKPAVDLQPGLPPALNDVIFMAIAKDPAKRFQTANAFRKALSTVKVAPSSSPLGTQENASEAATLETAVPAAILQATPAVPPTGQTPQPASASADAIAAGVSTPPAVPTSPPPPRSHRGLYMTLGGLIVLAGLVAAGVYMPRRNKTEAKVSAPQPTTSGAESMAAPSANAASPAPSQPPPAAMPSPATPSAVPQTALASPMAPAATILPTATPAALPPASTAHAGGPDGGNAGQGGRPPSQPRAVHSQKLAPTSPAGLAAPAYPQGVSTAKESHEVANDADSLDELEHQIDQLSSRAGAIDNGMERLQQQQAASGYGIRGDMAAHQVSMKNNLSKAQSALEHGDLERAKKYRDLAQGDVEALEHFLGH